MISWKSLLFWMAKQKPSGKLTHTELYQNLESASRGHLRNYNIW